MATEQLTLTLILTMTLAPLIAFGLITLIAAFGLSGNSLRRLAALSAGGAAAIGALSGWWLLLQVTTGQRLHANFVWATFGGRSVEVGVTLDPLSATVAALVATVALLVTIYSMGYMRGEERYARYFAYLSLFSGAMLVLVWSSSLLLLYIAWEIVGLASYLLIGYYWERPEAGRAASKAFLVTRIGDTGLMLAIAALFLQSGSFDIRQNLALVASGQLNGLLLTIIGVLLFMGAAGKSAQVPFQVWLPDAMAGPTPVSALIHSATMVAAGVYLVARMLPLVLSAPMVAGIVVGVGLVTSLLAGATALFQGELKRVLAYSTISQLGEMMVGLGLGSLAAGTFHLVIQGLFKAALFLAAGNIAHALGTAGRVEFERYGGAGRYLPLTRLAFLIAGLALAGIPVTLAPPSRDLILELALARQTGVAAGLVIADFLTAAYIARAFLLAFTETGSRRALSHQLKWEDDRRPKENRVMTGPLLALVGLVVVVGLSGSPLLGRPFQSFIEQGNGPTVPEGEGTLSFLLSVGAALAGIAVAVYYIALRPKSTSAPAAPTLSGRGRLNDWIANGFGFDALYTHVFVPVILALMHLANWLERTVVNQAADGAVEVILRVARIARGFDIKILDSFAEWITGLTLRLSKRQSSFDRQVVDRATEGIASSIGRSSGPLARLQTGQVGNYLLAIFVWGLLALVVSLFLGLWS